MRPLRNKIGIYNQGFSWTDQDEWLAPVDDWSTPVHCRLVSDETRWVLEHVATRGTCIQAGGNIGLWPARYAVEFKHVYTFEPSVENHSCLVRNLEGLDNVTIFNAAVGDNDRPVALKHPPNKLNRSGACYVEPDRNGKIAQVRVDDIGLQGSVDLIHFDIEGAELFALRGAEQVIKTHHPVITIENRRLPQMTIEPEQAIDYLKSLGYRIVAKCNHDMILKYAPTS
jgi:FkbM family methyltransferase